MAMASTERSRAIPQTPIINNRLFLRGSFQNIFPFFGASQPLEQKTDDRKI
jgi:hypothetical protein